MPALTFDAGLSLRRVESFTVSQTSITSSIKQEINVTVPDGTKWLDISIIKVEMAFGQPGNYIPHAVASIWFSVTQNLDGSGHLIVNNGKSKVLVEGILQGAGGTGDETYPWLINLLIQAKSFG